MTVSVAPAIALNQMQAHSDGSSVWYHAVFCQMALPLSPASGSWRRTVDAAGVTIEAAMPDHALPSGWCLRRLLMYICDTAVRTGNAVVEMGSDAASLAAEIGLPGTDLVLEEVSTQVESLLTAKFTVSLSKELSSSVFDARGQRRRPGAEWRTRIRLSNRFHASLLEHAIPLDRQTVTALAAEPLALDAHGWTRQVLHNQPSGQTTTVSWPDLLRRFGSPDQELQAFRASFEDALRMVFAADYSISLAADEEGVTVGSLAPEPDTASSPVRSELAAERVQEVEASPGSPATAVPASPSADLGYSVAPVPPPPAARPSSGVAEPRGVTRTEDHNAAAPASRVPPQAISLRSHLTGLPVVVWLRRGVRDEPAVISVTPGTRFEPDRSTVLILEPLVMQISGGLYQDQFDKVSAWITANRDLIDLFWEGQIQTFEEAASRVKKVPAPGWR
jgi:hypothetical protein